MEILGQADEWTNVQITQDFLRDFCPPELVEQVNELLEAQDWEALDQLMIPFHNT